MTSHWKIVLCTSLFFGSISCESRKKQDKREILEGEHNLNSRFNGGLGLDALVNGAALPPSGLGLHGPALVSRHLTITNRFAVPVPQPYPVVVERKVPVHQPVAVPVKVDRPYPVPVPQPIPVPVEKQVPVPVEKPFPVPVPQPVPVRVPRPVPIPVPRPIPVPVVRAVPVPVPQPVPVQPLPVPQPVQVQTLPAPQPVQAQVPMTVVRPVPVQHQASVPVIHAVSLETQVPTQAVHVQETVPATELATHVISGVNDGAHVAVGASVTPLVYDTELLSTPLIGGELSGLVLNGYASHHPW